LQAKQTFTKLDNNKNIKKYSVDFIVLLGSYMETI